MEISKVLGLSALGLTLLLPRARAQCVTCHDFAARDGWTQSPFLDCSTSTENCRSGGSPDSSFLSSLQPGFFTTQSNGQMTVSEVIPGSPAEQAGIRTGDIILVINGNVVGASCPSSGWESSLGSHRAELLIRRDGSERMATTLLVRFASLVASQWLTRYSFAEPVPASFVTSNGTTSRVGSYLVGLRFKSRAQGIVVDAVLNGSPAAQADIQPGDKLFEMDGEMAVSRNLPQFNDRTYGDRRFIVRLRLRRGSLSRTVTLQAEGLSEILRNATRSSLSKISKTDSATD
jgi:C-terminal processing protease CtpA/Prc